jgi:hypothetical protein
VPVQEPGAEPIIRVSRGAGEFRIDAPWLDEPVVENRPARAAANLVVDLVEAYLLAHPSNLCLHCGAAEFAGRLVVFPSRSRAGKSTLMARLAQGGMRIYTDDVLPLVNGERDGRSLGIAPRLRLPLPERASSALRGFVNEHSVLRDDDYAYLRQPSPACAAFGATAPLGAAVLLDRQEDGPPTLETDARVTACMNSSSRTSRRLCRFRWQ